jgi:Co/Zn/Cd efflux system component
VIAIWSYGLMRDTCAVLLDMNPDERTAENVRHAIEDGGDRVLDLHVWQRSASVESPVPHPISRTLKLPRKNGHLPF